MKTYHDGRVTVLAGDCIERLAELAPDSFDAVVTDPPYFLTSIVKRFGKDGSAPAQFGSDGRFSRLSGGFMNKRWDSPPAPVIDPAFAYWMAGFIDGEGCFSVHKKHVNGCETFDCQFTLTLRADDRPIVEQMRAALGGIGSIAHRPARNTGGGDKDQCRYCVSSKRDCQMLRAVLAAFPLRAKKARDFEIWCQALDAWIDHEPGSSWQDMAYFRNALMAVRNFGSVYRPERLFFYQVGRSLLRVLKPGAHFLAFGGSRTYHNMAVGFEDAGFEVRDCIAFLYGSGFPKSHNLNGEWDGWGTALKPAIEFIFLGRKPLSERTVAANVMQHGTGALNINGCRVGTDEALVRPEIRRDDNAVLGKGLGAGTQVEPLGRWPANVVHDGSPEVVEGFPDTASGTVGVRGGVSEYRRSQGEKTNDGRDSANWDSYRTGAEKRVRGHEDNGGSASRFFYTAKADSFDRLGSKHPTVKPLDLMQWLVRLVTPPRGHILDPFAGTGTTAEAALREGFRCTLIEREAEYLADIDRRMAHVFDGEVGRAVAIAKTKPESNEPAPLLDFIRQAAE